MSNVEKRTTLGKSLPVPSVQELAKERLIRVPERYVVRCENDHHSSIFHDGHLDDNHVQLPIIDMKRLISEDAVELQRLHTACSEWGFFQLINHGVSSSLMEKFKEEIQEFFNLPMEEKKKYWQTPMDVEGFGQAFVVSEEQKLDWADIFTLTTFPIHQRKSNLFPMLPLPYRNTLENYSGELQNLAVGILDCMAKALHINTKAMRDAFGEGKQTIRVNYYPPCPEPDKVFGLTPHSDAVALTILLQVNEIEGLQIKKDGKWVLVKNLPNSFVVNIGDMLEIMSNGIYQSVLHRAIVDANKERLSVAAFYSPAIDQEICPISSLITPKTPPKFKKISVVDYLKGLYARALNGKSYLDLMRINDNHECQENDDFSVVEG